MNIIYLLILISLVLIGVILAVFFWAIRSGQYDDLNKSGYDILLDDDDDDETPESPSDVSDGRADRRPETP